MNKRDREFSGPEIALISSFTAVIVAIILTTEGVKIEGFNTLSNIAQFLAHVATFLGILIALWTFRSQKNANLIQFTHNKASDFLENTNPAIVSDILVNLEKDEKLDIKKFKDVYWGKDRTTLRNAIQATDYLINLIDANELNMQTLGVQNVFGKVHTFNKRTSFYRLKAAEAYEIKNAETEFDKMQSKLEQASRDYDAIPI